MSPGLLSRSRLLTGCACALFVVLTAGAGCSTTPPAPTVSSKTLTVYLSAPSNLTASPQAQDVINAEKLAFTQLSGQVSGYTLRLRVLTGNKISDNARSAIEDKDSAIAYLGEVTPDASVDSLGITNGQDLLQVSPAEAGPVPTKDLESYSTYGRTFASLAPGSAAALAGGTAGKAFADDFHGSYGHVPSTQAVLGYVAMAAVLKALQNARSGANDRGTVRDDFFAPPKNVQLRVGPDGPVLGSYSVDKGVVTITPGSG